MKQWAIPILAIFAVVGIAMWTLGAGDDQAVEHRTAKAGDSNFNPGARYDGNPFRDGKTYIDPLLTATARHNGEPLHNAHRKSYAYPTLSVAARNSGEPRHAEWAYANPSLHPAANLVARNGIGEPDTSLTVYLAVRNTRNNGEPRYPTLSYARPNLRPILAEK